MEIKKAISLITRPTHKKVNGVMISGDISKNGLGHLIMHSGNINTFAYKQSLNFYKEDINRLGARFFQQDGARAQSSKEAQTTLFNLFGNNFIATWDNGPTIDGEVIPKWPPNSPALSATEML